MKVKSTVDADNRAGVRVLTKNTVYPVVYDNDNVFKINNDLGEEAIYSRYLVGTMFLDVTDYSRESMEQYFDRVNTPRETLEQVVARRNRERQAEVQTTERENLRQNESLAIRVANLIGERAGGYLRYVTANPRHSHESIINYSVRIRQIIDRESRPQGLTLQNISQMSREHPRRDGERYTDYLERLKGVLAHVNRAAEIEPQLYNIERERRQSFSDMLEASRATRRPSDGGYRGAAEVREEVRSYTQEDQAERVNRVASKKTYKDFNNDEDYRQYLINWFSTLSLIDMEGIKLDYQIIDVDYVHTEQDTEIVPPVIQGGVMGGNIHVATVDYVNASPSRNQFLGRLDRITEAVQNASRNLDGSSWADLLREAEIDPWNDDQW